MKLLGLPLDLLSHVLEDHVIESNRAHQLDVHSLMRALVLRGTCKALRQLLMNGGTASNAEALLEQYGVASMEHLAIAMCIRACNMSDGGNRIGFQYASTEIDDELGESSGVPNSRARIQAFAAILKRHPRATAKIEAHCGPAAPPRIAVLYSEERARKVMHELATSSVACDRVALIGHGKTVTTSTAMQLSRHPNSASARSGYGWVEIFIQIDGLELPARPDYYLQLEEGPCERTRGISAPVASSRRSCIIC
jgi:hypothetical protein